MKTSGKRMAKLLALLLILSAFSHQVFAAPIELSLDDGIALALQNNSDIKIAASEREKTGWALKQAKAGKGFSLNLAHSDTRYSSPAVEFADGRYSRDKFANTLSASLPVYSGGKLESQIEQAKLGLGIADLTVEATRQQIKQSVTINYFSVLQYQQELQVNRETVDNYTAHLKNVQDKYEIGTVAKLDVLASQVELADAQASLIKAQNNYDLAVASLNDVIGLPLDSELKLKEDLQYAAYSLTLEECSQYALVSRPEIAEYQTQVASAKEDIKVAKSGRLPTVDFAVAQSWYDKELPGLENDNWQVSLTASWNIFDSGLTKSQIKQSQHGLNTAAEQLKQKQNAILLEVRQYYLSLREAEKRIETQKVAVEQARESLIIAEARYDAGVGTNLDVLDAVLALNQARINDVQALYDYNSSMAQLHKAMGLPVTQAQADHEK